MKRIPRISSRSAFLPVPVGPLGGGENALRSATTPLSRMGQLFLGRRESAETSFVQAANPFLHAAFRARNQEENSGFGILVRYRNIFNSPSKIKLFTGKFARSWHGAGDCPPRRIATIVVQVGRSANRSTSGANSRMRQVRIEDEWALRSSPARRNVSGRARSRDIAWERDFRAALSGSNSSAMAAPRPRPPSGCAPSPPRRDRETTPESGCPSLRWP